MSFIIGVVDFFCLFLIKMKFIVTLRIKVKFCFRNQTQQLEGFPEDNVKGLRQKVVDY